MSLLNAVGRTLEKRAINANVFFDLLKERNTPSGKNVTVNSALEGTVAVYAAVSLLAETVGSLPLITYRRVDDRTRERITPTTVRWPGSLARMLHDGPNPEMTGQEFWENVEGHTVLWGDHFSLVMRAADARPNQMWPLRPDKMDVFRSRDERGLPTGPRRYVYTLPSGEKIGLVRSEVFHVMDLATDGVRGLSRITVARNAIGVEQAAAEYAGRFFANDARPGGLLMSPQVLDDDEWKKLRSRWRRLHEGAKKAHMIGILEGGMDWKDVGIPPKDAQFVELRRFQIEEVARLYRIPLHLLGDTTKESSWGTGIEQMTIGFVIYTLRSHLKRIEAAISRDLADPDAGRTIADESLFAEFKVEALLRGDMKTRAEFYSKGIQDGWLVPEDVRALENLPFIPGLDRPRLPSNFVLLGPSGEPPPPPEPPSNGDRAARREAFERAYEQHLRELAVTAP